MSLAAKMEELHKKITMQFQREYSKTSTKLFTDRNKKLMQLNNKDY